MSVGPSHPRSLALCCGKHGEMAPIWPQNSSERFGGWPFRGSTRLRAEETSGKLREPLSRKRLYKAGDGSRTRDLRLGKPEDYCMPEPNGPPM